MLSGLPPEIRHFSGFNSPEEHRHKPKSVKSLGQENVEQHSLALFHLTPRSYLKTVKWWKIGEIFLRLVDNLRKYVEYLRDQNDKVKTNHARPVSSCFSEPL